MFEIAFSYLLRPLHQRKWDQNLPSLLERAILGCAQAPLPPLLGCSNWPEGEEVGRQPFMLGAFIGMAGDWAAPTNQTVEAAGEWAAAKNRLICRAARITSRPYCLICRRRLIHWVPGTSTVGAAADGAAPKKNF
jgi:hypothetical protein